MATWYNFGASLPGRARVLDLGTGDGRVMRWLLERRPDLETVGIDLASTLPPPPHGATMLGGVAMDHLPFEPASFDAVVSQFGCEYAKLPAVCGEIARVLRADGVVGLITHRRNGPILAHNLQRREAILWAIEGEDLCGMAQRSLALRSAGITAVPAKITDAPARAAQLFGERSAAWEIAEAIRQTLALGVRDHPARLTAAIERIAGMARAEIACISALEAASTQLADEAGFSRALADARLVESGRASLAEGPDIEPFADFRTIRFRNRG